MLFKGWRLLLLSSLLLVLTLIAITTTTTTAATAPAELVSHALVQLHGLELVGVGDGIVLNHSTTPPAQRHQQLDAAIDLLLQAVFGSDDHDDHDTTTVDLANTHFHRWLANLGFALVLRGHRKTGAAVLDLAVQLHPLDNWLWDRCVRLLGDEDFTQHRCAWEPHMFFNPDVIHGKFYMHQLSVAEGMLCVWS